MYRCTSATSSISIKGSSSRKLTRMLSSSSLGTTGAPRSAGRWSVVDHQRFRDRLAHIGGEERRDPEGQTEQVELRGIRLAEYGHPVGEPFRRCFAVLKTAGSPPERSGETPAWRWSGRCRETAGRDPGTRRATQPGTCPPARETHRRGTSPRRTPSSAVCPSARNAVRRACRAWWSTSRAYRASGSRALWGSATIDRTSSAPRPCSRDRVVFFR